MIETQLKPLGSKQSKPVRIEDRGSSTRLEAMVLVERHAVDEPKKFERVQEVVDERRRCRDDEDSTRLQTLTASPGHDRGPSGRDVPEPPSW